MRLSEVGIAHVARKLVFRSAEVWEKRWFGDSDLCPYRLRVEDSDTISLPNSSLFALLPTALESVDQTGSVVIKA